MDLLLADGIVEPGATLKETYEKIVGIYGLERNDPKMWEMVWNHKILSLFQMEQQSGIQGIALTKPKSVEDLAHLNSVIRLMAQEKGGEQPLSKYARFKENPKLWRQEMTKYGLTEEEQQLLVPYVGGSYGICESQEGFMQLVQIPECGGFDLNFADRLRKSIAKKNPKEYEALTKEYFEVTAEKGLSKNLCNYVWNVLVATSRGYGFNLSHTLAYSLVALQEMNLAFRYPIIYWNCACLIVNSGGNNDEEDFDDESTSTDYTKIAKALGDTIMAGIKVSLVDINRSDFGFKPDVDNNQILFGMKALLNVNDDVVKDIIAKRPYASIKDFYYKVKPKKQAMISLIKSGAFDNMMERKLAMAWYIWETCDKKSRLTLQNLPGLIRYGLLPEDTEERVTARRIYEFNRYLKAVCKHKENSTWYFLDDRAITFLQELGYDNLIQENEFLEIKPWDKIYQGWMDVFRTWIAADKEAILDNLNTLIFKQEWDKYASGNYSSWEMEAMCFYYHDHELKNINYQKYGLSNFFKLPTIPVVERSFTKAGKVINIFELTRICGTCIAKNKNKGTVSLLTPEGVVNVRFAKELFAMFDKQLSEVQEDGTKKVTERSWFNRGQMIMVTGMRQGDDFVVKKYASTPGHRLYHIDEIINGTELRMSVERSNTE